VPEGQCLQKLVLFFDYLSSAYINGLWAAFGFVKGEGGFLVLGALVLGGLLSGGIFFRGVLVRGAYVLHPTLSQ